jgi:cytochrome c-type biogenesis protein CcmE
MNRLVVVSFVLVVALGVLVWVGVLSASIPVLRIAEVKESTKPLDDVQVDAKVAAIESTSPLRFWVYSEKDPANRLLVTSERSMPENFRQDMDVSLRGEYRKEDQVFVAYRITTQCPSRYQASKELEKKASAAAGGQFAPLDPRTAIDGASKVSN